MNGLAQILPDTHSSTRALSFSNRMPKIFTGRYNVAAVPTNIRGNNGKPPGNSQAEDAFGQMYGNQGTLGTLYKQGLSARDSEIQDLQTEMENANKGAPGADAFAQQCEKLGTMIRHDPGIELAFMDVGGWDTHVGQGNAKGQLANRLEKLGDGLMGLTQNLGDEYKKHHYSCDVGIRAHRGAKWQ